MSKENTAVTKKKIKRCKEDVVFDAACFIILTLVLFVVAYPLYWVIISSISAPSAVSSGKVLLHPIGFTLKGYAEVFKRPGYERLFKLPDHHLLRCHGQPDRNASDIICTFQKQFLRKETDHHILHDHDVLRRRADTYGAYAPFAAPYEQLPRAYTSVRYFRVQYDTSSQFLRASAERSAGILPNGRLRRFQMPVQLRDTAFQSGACDDSGVYAGREVERLVLADGASHEREHVSARKSGQDRFVRFGRQCAGGHNRHDQGLFRRTQRRDYSYFAVPHSRRVRRASEILRARRYAGRDQVLTIQGDYRYEKIHG